MKRKYFLFCFLLLLFAASCSRKSVLTFQGRTMGTFYTVKIAADIPEEKQTVIQKCIDSVFLSIDQSLNRYNWDSEISRFNRYGAKEAFQVSGTMMEVTKMADDIYRKSEGAFDPTIGRLVSLWGFGEDGEINPPQDEELREAMQHIGFDKIIIGEQAIKKTDPLLQIDYSAIAKGYGVDCLLEAIKNLGFENLLVEIGGEVRVSGTRYGKEWRIGIAAPDQKNTEYRAEESVISLRDMACATSGDYRQFYIFEGERYTHLIDPKTARPINHEVTSVTVIAGTCMLADAAATAAIVLGKEKGKAFIESLEDVEAYFIYYEENTLHSDRTSGWDKK